MRLVSSNEYVGTHSCDVRHTTDVKYDTHSCLVRIYVNDRSRAIPIQGTKSLQLFCSSLDVPVPLTLDEIREFDIPL